MTIDPSPTYDDEIDLRKLALTLLRKWKLLLIVMLLATAAGSVVSFITYPKKQLPVYTASSQIFIAQTNLDNKSEFPYPSFTSNPTSFLLSDPVRQKAAIILGVDAASLPTVSIAADATKSIYTITVQAASAQQAAQIVNAWADAGIEWINQTLALPNDEESKALARGWRCRSCSGRISQAKWAKPANLG